MHRNLFIAWFCLGVIALFLLAFFACVPFLGMTRAQGAFGVLGLLGLLPVFMFGFFRKEKNDERDLSFLQRAACVGMSCGFSMIFVVCTYIWVFYKYKISMESLPVEVLWIPAYSGLLTAILIFSVTLLVFYYKGENADKENGS